MEPGKLVERVKAIIGSQARLQSMAEAALTFAKPDATQEIAAEVVNVAQMAKTKRHKGASI
jgi:UDP-N-acetylglucosamine:LPS N-acetylglucosamine transferase